MLEAAFQPLSTRLCRTRARSFVHKRQLLRLLLDPSFHHQRCPREEGFLLRSSGWSEPAGYPEPTDLPDDGARRQKEDARGDDAEFLRDGLERVESMEEILEELEEYYMESLDFDDGDAIDSTNDNDQDDDDDGVVLWSEKTLVDLFGDLDEEDSQEDLGLQPKSASYDDDDNEKRRTNPEETLVRPTGAANLERALLQGVVPVSANVGSECLPGDFGFDPLGLASKDYFAKAQDFLLDLLPTPDFQRYGEEPPKEKTLPRPKALILRDYREAEIRHGRLAMLAAIFWPLQEMLDKLLLESDQVGPLIYGPVTLPYFPLLMTLIMMLLGYLDIYSQAIKDRDSIGEAFLPGDCFWDPLKILDGAPDSMKRNMQERELFNGRVAMLAVVVFIWEEATTHLQLADIEGNELLLKPLYQVPYVQSWLDYQFSSFEPEISEYILPSNVEDML